MDRTIELFTKKGWVIASQSGRGIQFFKPKSWSQFLLVLGAATLCLGFGFLILALAVIDYAIKKDDAVFVPFDTDHPVYPPSDNQGVVVVGLILIAITVTCFACLILSSTPPQL